MLCRLSLVALLLAAGCTPEEREPDLQRTAETGFVDTAPAAATDAVLWESAPSTGVRLDARNGSLAVETGPHAVLWPAGAEPLTPPYTVGATFQKERGRLHEGYGLVFGGERLDAEEEEQRYSYFLVRGDGSYLIRLREGPEVPMVRPWTEHPAVRPDSGGRGASNHLEVVAGTEEVAFRINGEEVERIPAGELLTRGVPGVRASHDVRLTVTGFAVEGGGR